MRILKKKLRRWAIKSKYRWRRNYAGDKTEESSWCPDKKTNIKINMKSTLVIHAWNPSMRESGAGGSLV